VAGEDQIRDPLYPEDDPAGELEVEPYGSSFISRLQTLKLAGAVTLERIAGLSFDQRRLSELEHQEGSKDEHKRPRAALGP
jgi:hypothetical protein